LRQTYLFLVFVLVILTRTLSVALAVVRLLLGDAQLCRSLGLFNLQTRNFLFFRRQLLKAVSGVALTLRAYLGELA